MRERPTVLLLHGGPGSFDHTYFKPDFAQLADVSQVVYVDLYGHGRSEWGEAAEWTFDLCADKVRDLCEALGLDRPIVLGHSLGAMVALVYAARHPQHPAALVIQSGMGRFDRERIVEGFRRMGGDEVAAIAARSYGGESVSEEEWALVWKKFGPWVPLDEERPRRIMNVELNEAASSVVRTFDVLGRLGVVSCPTLVCVGDLDPVTPVSAAEEIIAALPDGVGRLEVLEGAGHFPWRDVPDAYWPLLTGFVESVHLAPSR
jgi:proline iminopeptidase